MHIITSESPSEFLCLDEKLGEFCKWWNICNIEASYLFDAAMSSCDTYSFQREMAKLHFAHGSVIWWNSIPCNMDWFTEEYVSRKDTSLFDLTLYCELKIIFFDIG